MLFKRMSISILITIVFLMAILNASVGCKTTSPIIIYEPPILDVSDDMTIRQYLYESQKWGIDISAYIKELLNQIEHKVPYVDLRRGK